MAFITETWLKETIADSAVSIPGYTLIRKDRTTNNHGGVCLYVRDGCFKYHRLEKLCCCTDHEIPWVHLRPARLPRGFSCLVVTVLYHPPRVDINIREHLFNSLARAESIYSNCALVTAGDCNRLDVTRLKRHFHLKQIVKAPTPKDAILDLVLTNLHDHYNKPQTLPPFGLSDHSTLFVSPRVRKRGTASEKFILKREMGRYLCSLNWPLLLSSPETCDELLCVFEQVIHTGLDLLMPVRIVLMNTRDAPWMTQHLKDLIRKRQQAFHNNGADSVQYKFYRSRANRERKLCRAKFYESRVAHIKKEDPKA